MSRFSFRQFEAGDEGAINRLYQEITGRKRSLQEYLWQWHQSPSGPGDIWLIHDNENNGRVIGHHGVMPIRFTKGNKDLLFGKIENTMVLPEYRTKILYPRYESRFKQQYQARYHALFATMGPDSAIRIRKGLGYSFPVEWQSYMLRTSIWADLKCMDLLLRKLKNRLRKEVQQLHIGCNDKLIAAGFLTSLSAQSNGIFENFWGVARHNHGIAPRRDIEDLKWKFWTNPYKPHYTLVMDEANCKGYAIISLQDGIVSLEDYVVTVPSRINYASLFSNLSDALRSAGLSLLWVTSTNDAVLDAVTVEFSRRELICSRLFKTLKSSRFSSMPRYVTDTGVAEDLDVKDWAITGLIFEGR